MKQASDKRQRIWQCLGAIPRGRVVTYGQLAALAGLPGCARLVGTTLKQLPPGSALPWHRVINAAGRISFPAHSPGFERQRRRLEAEGILVKEGRVSLKDYRWEP